MHKHASTHKYAHAYMCNLCVSLIGDGSNLQPPFQPLLFFLQAAEKFLRSAVYMKDSTHYNHDFLRTIASATENTTLEDLADEIESLLYSSAALRYPNCWCYPSIPHDNYDKNKADEALKLAKKIFEEVDRIVKIG